MEGSWGKVKSVLAGLALGATITEMVKVADAMSLVDARLKLVTGSAEEFSTAQSRIYKVSQASNVGIAEMSALFTKLHEPVKRLGGGVKETGNIVEAFAASLRVGGASTQEAASATLQFAQAMGSGKLSGDEFRAIAEASPRFMKALAEGMDVPIERLKKMGSEGELTADVVGNALMKSLAGLREEMKSIPDTVGGALTRLTNDFKLAINDINQVSGTTLGIAGVIEEARSLIPTFKEEAVNALQSIGDWVDANKVGLRETWETIKDTTAELWEVVKAGASLVGFITQATTQSGLLKTILEAGRLLIAGFSDGVELIGASFATVGSQIMQVLVTPLTLAAKLQSAIVGVFDKDMAASIDQLVASTEQFAQAGEKYGEGVVKKFAAGESAVAQLGKKLEEAAASSTYNTKQTSLMGDAAETAGGKVVKLKNAHSEATKEQLQAANAWKKLTTDILSRVTALQAEFDGVEKLSELEKLQIDLYDKVDAGIIKLTLDQKLELDAMLEKGKALEKEITLQKALLKQAEEVAERRGALRRKENDDIEQYLADQKLANIEVVNQANAVVRAAQDEYDNYGKLKSQIAQVTLARLENVLAMKTEGSDAYKSVQGQIEAQQRLIDILKKGEARDEWVHTIDTLSTGLINALEGGFKSGWKFMRDYAKREVIRIYLEPMMKSTLSQLLGGGAGGSNALAGTLGAGGGAGGGGGLLSSAQNLYSAGSKLWDGFSSGFDTVKGWMGMSGGAGAAAYSGLGSGFGSGALTSGAIETGGFTLTGGLGGYAGAGGASFGGAAGTIGTEAIAGTAAEVGASAAAASAASWIPIVGWAYAAFTAGKGFYEEGYSAATVDSKAFQLDPSVMGANVLKGLGLSDKLSNILSSASGFGKIFGRAAPKVESQSLVGTFGGEGGGFSGNIDTEMKSKGGFLRSDKKWTESTAVTGELNTALDEGAAAMKKLAVDYGKALGLPVEQLDKVTASVSIKLGDTEEAVTEAMTKAMQTYTDALFGTFADSIKPLQEKGETISQTLERVGGNLTAVNAVLDGLGLELLDTTLAGGKAATSLIGMMGGMDKFTAASTSYYENFYSQGEQTQMGLAQIGEALAAVNLPMPTTREGFRDLVEGLDLNVEAQRKQYAALMSVNGAFATFVPAVDTLAEAARNAAEALQEREGLETRLLQLQGNTAELRARERASLDETNRALYDEITALEDAQDAMDAVAQAAEDAAQAAADLADTLSSLMDSLRTDLDNAMSGVESAVAVEQSALTEAYNSQMDALNAAADAARLEHEATSKRIDDERDIARATYQATMTGIKTQRDALELAADAQAKMYGQSVKSVEAERTAAREAYSKASAELNLSMKTASDTVSRLKSLNSTLKSTLDSMRPINSEATVRSRAQDQIRQAVAIAKASGVLPDVATLQKSLSVVAQPSEELFGSFQDYLRDFYYTSNDIATLADISGDQLDDAQTQLEAVISMKEALDAANTENMARLDGIREALDVANEIFKEQLDIQRASLDAREAAAQGTYDKAMGNLDQQQTTADEKLENTLDALESQKELLTKAYEADMKVFDDILSVARDQYTELTAINTNTGGVPGALAALATAMQSFSSATGKPLPVGVTPGKKNEWVSSGGVSTYTDPLGAVGLALDGKIEEGVIKGVSGSTLSIADAQSSIAALSTTPGGFQTISTTATNMGVSSTNVDLLGGYNTGTTAALSAADPSEELINGYTVKEIQDYVNAMLDEQPPNEMAIYKKATSLGFTSSTLDAVMGWSSGTSRNWAKAAGLPAFEFGGDHMGGLRVVGEDGPELEATGPSRIFTAEQLMRGSNTDDSAAVVAELKQLLAELQRTRVELNAGLVATASNTGKTARQLERWDTDGLPQETT